LTKNQKGLKPTTRSRGEQKIGLERFVTRPKVVGIIPNPKSNDLQQAILTPKQR
jgi:hypothetical protein